ncbi:hypothetical protein KC865_01390 [Candidatus Kaiserbacteria bacterium]|nr:hypothetical protein [Candidatus Kaiserbacteria bacterium]USN92641.1 MAG: hypothetical protein H6782_02405 [Candidatus Nomurabacteria bacterium]
MWKKLIASPVAVFSDISSLLVSVFGFEGTDNVSGETIQYKDLFVYIKKVHSGTKKSLFYSVSQISRTVGHVLSLGWNQFEELCIEWLEEARVIFV